LAANDSGVGHFIVLYIIHLHLWWCFSNKWPNEFDRKCSRGYGPEGWNYRSQFWSLPLHFFLII